jgi:hypothetical protein
VAYGRCDDQIDIGRPCCTRRQDYSSIRPLREGGDDAFDLSRSAQVDWAYLDAYRWRYRLNSGSSASIAENCQASHAWRNLLEEFTGTASLDLIFDRKSN